MYRFHSRARPCVDSRIGVCHFFSPQESDASIQSALLVPGRPCVVFTRPVVFALEIQPHDDPKTTQRGLGSHQPPSAMLCVFSPAPGIDLRVALQASINFQPWIGVVPIFSPHSGWCMDFSLLGYQLLLLRTQELGGHHLSE
ncbi:hypothetical protein NDU88_008809 [Pleurodeles waltl]|uniref:Uncharacterized protein n=1 Tax=Pleurodeles waltl TaxID=8319 RepID=A0AAV7PQJ6_PLEWA|nr:hypothetical protein NDU88_008809 [Pleurodeles waltl]